MSTNETMISVVMPVYIKRVDELAWLRQALDSALGQTLPCEVVVWDDGSELNLSDVRKDYPTVRWYRFEENRGVVAARNAAVNAASGPWVLPVDHDDQLEKEAAEVLLNALGGRGDGFAYSDLHFFGPGVEMVYPSFDFDLGLLLRLPYISVSILYTKDAWGKVGGYDARFERGFEDWAFAVALALAGYRGVRAKHERPLLWYRFRPEARRKQLEPHKQELLAAFKTVFAEALRAHPDPRRSRAVLAPAAQAELVAQPRPAFPGEQPVKVAPAPARPLAGDPDANVRYVGSSGGTISVYGRASRIYYSVSAGRPLLRVDPADYPKIVSRGDFVPHP